MKIKDIVEATRDEHPKVLLGDISESNKVSSIFRYSNGTLTFCSMDNYNLIREIHNGIIIIDNKINERYLVNSNTYVLVDNPRLSFLRVMKEMYPEYVEPNIDIGDGCEIDSSAIIGRNGFGHIRNEKGELENFISIGGVRIGDNVEIGGNTCIDRGTIDDTIIGEGTKIDNLVNIAHNIKIGKHCEIINGTMTGGGCEIGDYTRIAHGCTIRDGIRIGSHSLIGVGSVVVKDIGDYELWYGNPAKFSRRLRDE